MKPSPFDRVTLALWDVRYVDGGLGKHGNGPFPTEARARASLRAVGWPGTVERIFCTTDRRHADAAASKVPAKPVRIGWPADGGELLMWAEGPDWNSGFFVDAPFAGDHLAGFLFASWHAALTLAMHWAYDPTQAPPDGWELVSD